MARTYKDQRATDKKKPYINQSSARQQAKAEIEEELELWENSVTSSEGRRSIYRTETTIYRDGKETSQDS